MRGVGIALEWVDEKVAFRALGLEVCTWLKCWQRWMVTAWATGQRGWSVVWLRCRVQVLLTSTRQPQHLIPEDGSPPPPPPPPGRCGRAQAAEAGSQGRWLLAGAGMATTRPDAVPASRRPGRQQHPETLRLCAPSRARRRTAQTQPPSFSNRTKELAAEHVGADGLGLPINQPPSLAVPSTVLCVTARAAVPWSCPADIPTRPSQPPLESGTWVSTYQHNARQCWLPGLPAARGFTASQELAEAPLPAEETAGRGTRTNTRDS